MNQAIKILDIQESTWLKVFPLTKDIPLEEQVHCPACNIPLKVLCLLVNRKRDQKIRYGLCPSCGYMGYIDRPQRSWMIDFYTMRWDKTTPLTEAEIRNRTFLPGQGVNPSGYLAVSLVSKINLNKNQAICDIGSGYGEALTYFKGLGYENLIGIENSKHRADLVNKIFGFQIFHGEFENQKIQEKLSSYKNPIGLFFSHQVLEHVYHPQEILGHVSALQELGGHVVIAVPNATGEHINHAPLFLPHLHSFTKKSIETLLNKNGYEVVVDNSVASDIIVAARKVENPQPKITSSPDYFEIALARLKKGFATNLLRKGRICQLHWGRHQDQDHSQIISESTEGIIPRVLWYLSKKFVHMKIMVLKRFVPGCTMLVTCGENKESSFEIQFHDKILLLIK